MEARSEAPHNIGGDDIIAALDRRSRDVRWILRRGFKMLFGISHKDWHQATREQKDLTFSC